MITDYSVAIASVDEHLLHYKDKFLKEIFSKQSEAIENVIAHQLNEFISRGLIVVERTHSSLVRSATEDKIEIREAIKLKLKDQEYVERLEKENNDLKQKIHAINSVLFNQNNFQPRP